MTYAGDKFHIVWSGYQHANEMTMLTKTLELLCKTEGLWWCKTITGAEIAINPLSSDIHAIVVEEK